MDTQSSRILIFLSLGFLIGSCDNNLSHGILTKNPEKYLGKWQVDGEIFSIAKQGNEFILDFGSDEKIFSYRDGALVGQSSEMLFYHEKDDCLFFAGAIFKRIRGEKGDYVGRWKLVLSRHEEILDSSRDGDALILKQEGRSRADTLVSQDGVFESASKGEFYIFYRFKNRDHLFLSFKATRVKEEPPETTTKG